MFSRSKGMKAGHGSAAGRIVSDGDANATPGGDFSRGLGAGTKLSFADANGDTVSLSLKKGGLMELTIPTTGNPTLRLSGTVAGTSTLAGSVKKRKTGGGDGRTSLASITGSAGVNRTGLQLCSAAVTVNCFSVTSISARVLDRLFETDRLSRDLIVDRDHGQRSEATQFVPFEREA